MSNASYYLADGLGSTTQLVDGSGSVTDTYTYDVFGALRSTTGSTPNPFDFAGQQTDHTANRGLQYLRARHYDPSLGRFLGRDPRPSSRPFIYADDNPANRADPSGECNVSVSIRSVGGGSSSGSVGGFHAYIVTADPITGEKNLFEGGPQGGRRFFGIPFGAHIAANGGPIALGYGVPGSSASSYATDRRTYAQFGELNGKPESCSALNSEFHRIATRIENARLPYRILRQNSNAVVSELLQSAGLPVVHPSGYLPSWGTDLGDFADKGAW